MGAPDLGNADADQGEAAKPDKPGAEGLFHQPLCGLLCLAAAPAIIGVNGNGPRGKTDKGIAGAGGDHAEAREDAFCVIALSVGIEGGLLVAPECVEKEAGRKGHEKNTTAHCGLDHAKGFAGCGAIILLTREGALQKQEADGEIDEGTCAEADPGEGTRDRAGCV